MSISEESWKKIDAVFDLLVERFPDDEGRVEVKGDIVYFHFGKSSLGIQLPAVEQAPTKTLISMAGEWRTPKWGDDEIRSIDAEGPAPPMLMPPKWAPPPLMNRNEHMKQGAPAMRDSDGNIVPWHPRPDDFGRMLDQQQKKRLAIEKLVKNLWIDEGTPTPAPELPSGGPPDDGHDAGHLAERRVAEMEADKCRRSLDAYRAPWPSARKALNKMLEPRPEDE